jgi:flagellin
MPQIINTNIASLNAQRNLDRSQSANQTALQRLSSGLRINSAKDDAAGLAISTRFTSQIKGLNVAVRNAGDGIALAQTAEGALGSINENLQRIRELAVQSANATNSDVDRDALQSEVDQLLAEVSRTADETDFNGRKLLDGSFSASFQIGANAGQTVDVSISELTAEKLGASKQSGVSSNGTDYGLSNGDLSINGVAINPSVATDDNKSTVGAAASGIAIAAAINRSSEETGVKAFANKNEVNGTTMTSGAGATSASVEINGVSFSLQATNNTNDVEKAQTRKSTIEAINAKSDQTGVVASDGGNENGVILTAADGRNIVIEGTGGNVTTAFGLAAATTTAGAASSSLTGISAGVYESGVTLIADGDTKDIKITGGSGTGTGDIARTGFTEGDYKKSTATITTVAQDSSAAATGTTAATLAIEEGDLVINNVTISASSSVDDKASDTTANSSDASGSAIAIAAAINKSSESTGVTAKANETVLVGVTGAAPTTAATAGTTLGIVINNVDVGTVTSQGDIEKDRAATISAINAKSGQTGVVAEDNGEGITLKASDGRNVSVTIGSSTAGALTGGTFGLDTDVDGIGTFATGASVAIQAVFATTAETKYATVQLESAKTIDIEGGSNGTAGLTDSGFKRGEYGGGEDGQFLKDLDISTVEGAQKALTAIDNAIGDVASNRAELGAVQNRLESTVKNLQVTSENLNAANSRIKDADFAAETAELQRTNVLQQAGISVLAQANTSGQRVLSLLG